MDLAAGLQLLESQPYQTSLLAYATDYRVAGHEFDIERARETLQTTRHVDGVTDHDDAANVTATEIVVAGGVTGVPYGAPIHAVATGK